MSNEAFRLLSRGGVVFQPSKSKKETALFEQHKSTESPSLVDYDGTIPTQLDFFKNALPQSKKRRLSEVAHSPKGKKRKVESDDDDNDNEEYDQEAKAGPNSTQKHRVSTKGNNVPQQVDSFRDLQFRYRVPSHLLSNLSIHGYHQPTSIQSYCLPILLENRDLVAISPTGTGKTLAYLLPIFSSLAAPASSQHGDTRKGVRALIIVPTRELAHQIHNECLKLVQGRKWKIILFSKATSNALSDTSVREKVDIIVSTPLRLGTALQQGLLKLDNVQHLVLDEADRLLDAEFMPQIQSIVGSCTNSTIRKALLSATLPAGAEKVALDMLQDPIRVVVGLKDIPLPLIAQSLTYVADDPSKLPSLLTHFARPYNPPVLVFVSTQARATSLTEELVLNLVSNVDCLHAGMTPKQREDTLARMKNGETWVLVTTEVMARGMDFRGVREVINYDFPTSIQSYVHRIGRTGRAGREGKAVTFFTDEDAPYLKSIANVILQSGFTVPEWIRRLPKPSKIKRRQMGKIRRPDIVNPARKVGKRAAIKQRDMVLGSKRRKFHNRMEVAEKNAT